MAESNVKHTPGPWKVLPEEADRSYIRIRGTQLGGKYKIANVLVTNEFDVEEARANANLIAAAPELLEALKDLLRDAQDRLTEVPDELYHRCREIINRAEGRS